MARWRVTLVKLLFGFLDDLFGRKIPQPLHKFRVGLIQVF